MISAFKPMHMHQMQARQGNFELEVVVKQNVRNWCHRLTHTETCTSEYIQLNMLSSLKDLISWYYIHNKDACNQARMKQVCTHSHSFTHTHTHTRKQSCMHTYNRPREDKYAKPSCSVVSHRSSLLKNNLQHNRPGAAHCF